MCFYSLEVTILSNTVILLSVLYVFAFLEMLCSESINKSEAWQISVLVINNQKHNIKVLKNIIYDAIII